MKKQRARLRTRKLSDGRESLYIDIYSDGRRQYEFLKMYLIPPTNRAAVTANKETMRRAEAIRQSREADAISGVYSGGIRLTLRGAEAAAAAGKSKGSADIDHAAILQALAYDGRADIELSDINRAWMMGYCEYLVSRIKCGILKRNTASVYYSSIRALLRYAERNGVNVNADVYKVAPPSREETHREYLTIEELRRLIDTPCPKEALRRYFLFSCLTGLRYSDIAKLIWREVQDEAEGSRIVFRQKKTGHQEYCIINPQARAILGVRRDDDERVLRELNKTGMGNLLRQWAATAGINKHITFHSARHTFATMMLTLGVDIYTVSKLLGHHNIATTQIYAKIIDKKKEEAVQLIPDFEIQNSSH
ncbi:MAG: tyrosine-type recombinase/integrase [Muribaculaceae bacterium]